MTHTDTDTEADPAAQRLERLQSLREQIRPLGPRWIRGLPEALNAVIDFALDGRPITRERHLILDQAVRAIEGQVDTIRAADAHRHEEALKEASAARDADSPDAARDADSPDA